MDAEEMKIRHLVDLCRRAEKTGLWVYSGFLSLAEQQAFRQAPVSRGLDFHFWGGSEWAERRILAAGSEDAMGFPADYPLSLLSLRPASEKYGEELTHRDYLGAVLNLGIDRELTGDILVQGKHAWMFCLDSAADLICGGLTRVRHTTVITERAPGDAPPPEPSLEPLSLNVASERLDAIVAGLTGLSRARASELFPAGKVHINGQPVADGSKTLTPGDLLSVRGYGKVIYDGIRRETKKSRLVVALRKF